MIEIDQCAGASPADVSDRSVERSTRSWYPESLLGGFSRIDGTVAFYSRVNALLAPSSFVVDFGCGRGRASEDPVVYRRELQFLKGKARKVVGLDIDCAGFENPGLNEFRRLDESGTWPLPDRSADLVLADNVIEHLQNPGAFFSEARRVLVPGGYLCARTPNRLGYVSVISRIVPECFHSGLLSRAQSDRATCDVFPTFYRCNTVPASRRALRLHGFTGVVLTHESEPRYLGFSTLAYAAGVLYGKLAPVAFRNVLFVFARKVDEDA